jgi:Regulator of ribonuclease activity B
MTPKKLELVADYLTRQGYRFVEIFRTDDDVEEVYFLHVEKIEHHTPETLDRRNRELYDLAEKFDLILRPMMEWTSAQPTSGRRRPCCDAGARHPENSSPKPAVVNENPFKHHRSMRRAWHGFFGVRCAITVHAPAGVREIGETGGAPRIHVSNIMGWGFQGLIRVPIGAGDVCEAVYRSWLRTCQEGMRISVGARRCGIRRQQRQGSTYLPLTQDALCVYGCVESGILFVELRYTESRCSD